MTQVAGRRRAGALVAVLVLVLLPGGSALGQPSGTDELSAGPAVVYTPPVEGEPVRGFEQPAGVYGPGHRGVDFAAVPGEPVVAAADGTVVHAGPVAGTSWVSVDHADGVRTAYGPLDHLRVEKGEAVTIGQRLGDLADGGHGPHGLDEGVHFSARRDGLYIDPMTLPGIGARPSLIGPGVTAPQAAGGPLPPPVDAPADGPLSSLQGPPIGGPLVTPITHVR